VIKTSKSTVVAWIAGGLFLAGLAVSHTSEGTRRRAGDHARPAVATAGVDAWRPELADDGAEPVVTDGLHAATVRYYNPATGYSATYSLEVEVEDGDVTTIYFPRGGRLDGSHISPTELDADGTADVYDDEGREYQVEVEQ